jgi:hypothetical protein
MIFFSFAFDVRSHSSFETELCLSLTLDEAKQLGEFLQVLLKGEREVNFRLNQKAEESWRLFWKMREGDSRALLARPDPQSWVGTIALERAAFEKLVAHLSEGKGVSLEEIASLHAVSNIHLRFEVSK